VLLEALDDLVHERLRRRVRPHRRSAPRPPIGPTSSSTPNQRRDQSQSQVPHGPAYEVMYLLDADEAAVEALRSRLSDLGDSLVVVGGASAGVAQVDGSGTPDARLWNVHVHVDDPGAAVEAGIAAGRPHQIRITHFADQVATCAPASQPPGDGVAVGLVACAAGPGLAALFAQAGAVVVHAGPGRRPSTGEILDAVRRTRARSVVVLPNDPDTLAVANAAAGAAREAGIRVSILSTRAQVQGLAAAAVHDPTRHVDDDVVRMSAAAAASRDGAVTVATRSAPTSAGPCRTGDVLGVVDGDVVVIGRDVGEVAVAVLDRLLAGGGELVTLVHGQDADPAAVARVAEHLAERSTDVEVCVLDGGQPRYPLLVGVE
jgi:hypothetical protein